MHDTEKRQRPFIRVLVFFAVSGCYPKGDELCVKTPSTQAQKTFDQICNGVKTTFTHNGCSGDDGWVNEAAAACAAACKTPPVTCTLVKTASIGGSCIATGCGKR